MSWCLYSGGIFECDLLSLIGLRVCFRLMCSNNINTIYYGIEGSYRECPKDWKESSPVTFVDEEHSIGAHSLTAVRPTEGDLYTF